MARENPHLEAGRSITKTTNGLKPLCVSLIFTFHLFFLYFFIFGWNISDTGGPSSFWDFIIMKERSSQHPLNVSNLRSSNGDLSSTTMFLPSSGTASTGNSTDYSIAFLRNDVTVKSRGCPIGCESSLNRCSVFDDFANASLLKTGFALLQNSQKKHHFVHLPFFDKDDTYGLGGVALFQNAYVEGDFSIVFDCDVLYVSGGCGVRDANKYNFDIRKVNDSSLIHRLDTAILISQHWGNAYYHSMIENLPKLVFVADFLQAHPNTSIMAYETLIKGRRLFEPMFNLTTKTKWVSYNHREIYHVRKLLIPSATYCGNANPHAVIKFQYFFQKYLDTAAKKKGKKNERVILVQKRKSRYLTNHKDLMFALRNRFGKIFKVVEFFGNETIEETAAMHRSATVVVGPHGAGLSHVIFMLRNASGMIEIYPKVTNRGVNGCHQATAKAAGVLSRLLVMEKINVTFGDPYPVENISLVLQTVEEMLDLVGSKNI